MLLTLLRTLPTGTDSYSVARSRCTLGEPHLRLSSSSAALRGGSGISALQGSMYSTIEEKLTAGLQPAKLIIVDNSHKHAGHVGVNGREYAPNPTADPDLTALVRAASYLLALPALPSWWPVQQCIFAECTQARLYTCIDNHRPESLSHISSFAPLLCLYHPWSASLSSVQRRNAFCGRGCEPIVRRTARCQKASAYIQSLSIRNGGRHGLQVCSVRVCC